MLFHSLVDADSDAYLDQARLLLDGVSDPGALARPGSRWSTAPPSCAAAWIWEDVPEPLQVVHRRVAVPVTYHDWRVTARKHERGTPAAAAPGHDRAAGVDLTAPPLLRLAIARLSRRPGPAGLDLPPPHPGRLEPRPGARRGLRAVRRDHQRPRAAACRHRRPFRDYLHWLRAPGHRPRRGALAPASWPASTPPPRCPTTGAPAQAHRTESSRTGSRSRSPADESERLQQRRPAQRPDRQHHRAGRLGAAAVPLQRTPRRRVRHHRLRPARRAARRRVDHRHVHQHRADPRPDPPAGRTPCPGCATCRPGRASPAVRLRLACPSSRPGATCPAGRTCSTAWSSSRTTPSTSSASPGRPATSRDVQAATPPTSRSPCTPTSATSSTIDLAYDPALFDTATVERMAGAPPGPPGRHRR